MSKIVAFDVETPNMDNDRICAIGISIIENKQIIETKSWLVNPECEFDEYNIGIHHIKPEDVEEAPTFDIVWDEIKELFRNNVVAAHNAVGADLLFLNRTLKAYGINEEPLRFICTLQWSRKLYPDMSHHRLNDMCEVLHISLDHHNVASDCRACAELVVNIMNQGINPFSRYRLYHWDEHDIPKSKVVPATPQKLSYQAILSLEEIITNVTANIDALFCYRTSLENWIEAFSQLRNIEPFDNAFDTIDTVLELKDFDSNTRELLLSLYDTVIDPISNETHSTDFDYIRGKTICLTGIFETGTKEFVAELLKKHGAIIEDNIKRDLNILLIGAHGNSLWNFKNYGTKVAKVKKYNSSGSNIELLQEADLFKNIKVNQ